MFAIAGLRFDQLSHSPTPSQEPVAAHVRELPDTDGVRMYVYCVEPSPKAAFATAVAVITPVFAVTATALT